MQMACHLRSVSLPTRPHSLVLKTEGELQKLRSCMASPSLTAEMICDAFKGISNLYERIEELVCLPSNRNSLLHTQQKQLVEEELERSVQVLDLCDKMRDNLATKKVHIQDFQSALRGGRYAAMASKVQSYIRSVKKGDKDIKKLMTSKCGPLSSIKEDSDLSVVVRLLTEAREITISLLRSVLSFLFSQFVRPKSSNWSLVSKAFNKKKVACEEGLEYANFAIASYSWKDMVASYSWKDMDDERVSRIRKQLQTLEANIEGLANGVDFLFRRLIQTRVALLNVLSS